MPNTDFDNNVLEYIAKAKDESPTKLFVADLAVLLKTGLTHFLNVFLPIRTAVTLPGVEKHTVRIFATYVLIGVLALFESLVLISVPFVLVFCLTTPLPLWFTVIPATVGYLTALGVCWFVASLTWAHGPQGLVVNSELHGVDIDVDKFEHEKWIFVNGIATSHLMLQSTCDMLASQFRRPITGIHNRSFGIIGDLLECLIQRDFSYATLDVRVTYEALSAALQDDEIHKLVVIAHSQGGILVSLALERLYSELPVQIFRKLEIYTFGSAASRFKNPLLSLPSPSPSPPSSPSQQPLKHRRTISNPSGSSSQDPATKRQHAISHTQPSPPAPLTSCEIPNHYIPVIEHYANALDLVPRWGVLYHAKRTSDTDYSGRVFVRLGASGHLIDQHYIQAMFGALARESAGPYGALGAQPPKGEAYLDYKVRLTDASAVDAAGQTGQGTVVVFQGRGGVSASDDGKSVRDVSRFWRYLDGGEISGGPEESQKSAAEEKSV